MEQDSFTYHATLFTALFSPAVGIFSDQKWKSVCDNVFEFMKVNFI